MNDCTAECELSRIASFVSTKLWALSPRAHLQIISYSQRKRTKRLQRNNLNQIKFISFASLLVINTKVDVKPK